MAHFPQTRWTQIRLASEGDRSALTEFVQRYRPPVVAYFARRGLGAEAEDLAQEVFLRFLDKEVLAKADPERGRFRGLVMAVTRRVFAGHFERRAAKKRGGDAVVQALGDLDLAAPDEDFDREWVGHLLERSLGRLEEEHPNYHAALSAVLLEQRSHVEAAEALGCAAGDVNNWVHRGKKKVIAYLQEEVRRYTCSEAEYQDELRQLSRLLPI